MEQLRKKLRRLQARQLMQQRRRDEKTNLSQFTLQTALLISLVLGYDFSAGAAWLQVRRRRGTPLAEGLHPAQVSAMLEDAFLDADVHELAAWTDPDHCPLSISVRTTAANYVRGRRLAEWVREQNTSRGAVVPSRVLVHRYNSSPCAAVVGLAPFSAASTASSSGRVWASRWRATFGGKHMRLRLQDPVSLEERRSKVWRNVMFVFMAPAAQTGNLGPQFGRSFGPHFGSVF